jgi:AraC-like DNA-binding protein
MRLPLSIKTQSGQPLIFTDGLPEAFSHYKLNGSKAYHASYDNDGFLLYQQIANDRFTTWISHFVITKPIAFMVKAGVNDLLLHYTMQGDMFYVIDHRENMTASHQMNIVICARLNHLIRFKTPGVYIALNVHIPFTELEELHDSFPVVQYFIEQTTSGNSVTLFEQSIIANERLRNIVQDITDRQLINAAREKYHIQKTTELIIDSLDMLSDDLENDNGLDLSDNERVEKTEALLLAHLKSPAPPTLKQLARHVGTNEKKLEMIFKTKHHMTIYDYFLNARMRVIYRKLTETDTSLQNLAINFGYTDYSSFSYAVKKRFGISPKDLRKKDKW